MMMSCDVVVCYFVAFCEVHELVMSDCRNMCYRNLTMDISSSSRRMLVLVLPVTRLYDENRFLNFRVGPVFCHRDDADDSIWIRIDA